MIVCKAKDRYFDLDAVRGPASPNTHARAAAAVGTRENTTAKANMGGNNNRDTLAITNESNPAGAPPLDWWSIPPKGYEGSHYAVYPLELCERPIKAMCPERVCTVCGEPSRRITEVTGLVDRDGREVEREVWRSGMGEGKGAHSNKTTSGTTTTTTTGWTDCGHGSYACATCGVLVPLGHAVQRSGQAARGEAAVGGEAVLGEPIEGAGGPADDAGDVRDVRRGVLGSSRSALLHPELFGATSASRGPSEHDQATESDPRTKGEPPRLHPGLGSGRDAGTTGERLHDGASAGDAGAPGPTAGAVGGRPPSQRREGRQPVGEPRGSDQGETCGDGRLPALPGDVPGQLDEGYVCRCGSREIKYVADHWRSGIVLDPFGGSGTTVLAALGHGRSAVAIDLDARNVALAQDRLGLFPLEVVDHLNAEAAS